MGCSVIQEDSAHAGDKKTQQVSGCGNGILPFQKISREFDEQRGRRDGSLSLVSWKGITGSPRLFVKHEHTGLAGKTDFLHLPVFAEEQRIIG
jgi:hypothetical protein